MTAAQRVLVGALCTVLAAASGASAMADTLNLNIEGKTYQIELNASAEAQLLKAALPLKLEFEDFGRNERIAYLPHKLDIKSWKKPVEVKRGSLAYYVPWGNLCIFRVDYSSPNDLVLLGQMSEEAVRAVEKHGSGTLSLP